jgi:capsular exopolysaccharide synthesis family protein
MERIEKALAKAREQRRAHTGTPRPAALLASATMPPPLNTGGSTATRVVAASPATMRENRVIAGFAQDPRADLFRMLRAQVLHGMEAVGGTTLGICSPNPGDGKTTIAANLAVSLAMDSNHTVLLVDLDLRQPKLSECFGLTPQIGMSDYLFDGAPLSDCLVNPGIDRLVLLPAGRPLSNSSEALASPQMVNLARELKARYPDRIVIYDLPPLLASDDALVFLPLIDATLLIVCEGLTSAGDVRRTVELLDQRKLLGTVLNRSSEAILRTYT